MLKINPLSTLYVGIDVSSKSNAVCAMDFYRNKYVESSFANNQPGTDELVQKILECLNFLLTYHQIAFLDSFQ